MNECPTPWKEKHTKRQAKAAVRDMSVRHRKSKGKMAPVEVYQCVCGYHHIAGKSTRRHQ